MDVTVRQLMRSLIVCGVHRCRKRLKVVSHDETDKSTADMAKWGR